MKPRIPAKRPAPIPFTPQGHAMLEQTIEKLIVKRKTAVINLRTARDMGDLSENGAYKAARFELSDIDRQLRKLTFQKRYAVVLEEKNSSGNAGFGSRVTLRYEGATLKIMLVGSYESDPGKGKISVTSPLGHALIGKHSGDTIVVTAPSGNKTYSVVSVE